MPTASKGSLRDRREAVAIEHMESENRHDFDDPHPAEGYSLIAQ